MKNRILAVTGLVLLGVASPAFAAATGSWSTGTTCGGSNFQTCVSVSVSWTDQVVTLTAENLGSAGEVWKSLGLANMPSGLTYWVTATSLPGGRSYPDIGSSSVPSSAGPSDLSGDGIPGTVYGSLAGNPAPSKGLANGETGTWVFHFYGWSGTDGQWNEDMTNAQFAVHAISGPNSCSTKLFTTGTDPHYADVYGQNGSGEYDAACASTVPEPAGMALLATGLVGLGGAGLIRRRRREK